MDAIYFRCRKCGNPITASLTEVNASVICPYCEIEITVPEESEEDLANLNIRENLDSEDHFDAFAYVKYLALIPPLFSITFTMIKLIIFPTKEVVVVLNLIFSNLLAIYIGGIFFLVCILVEKMIQIKRDTSVLSKIELTTEGSGYN